jgi:hypothetical protein
MTAGTSASLHYIRYMHTTGDSNTRQCLSSLQHLQKLQWSQCCRHLNNTCMSIQVRYTLKCCVTTDQVCSLLLRRWSRASRATVLHYTEFNRRWLVLASWLTVPAAGLQPALLQYCQEQPAQRSGSTHIGFQDVSSRRLPQLTPGTASTAPWRPAAPTASPPASACCRARPAAGLPRRVPRLRSPAWDSRCYCCSSADGAGTRIPFDSSTAREILAMLRIG